MEDNKKNTEQILIDNENKSEADLYYWQMCFIMVNMYEIFKEKNMQVLAPLED